MMPLVRKNLVAWSSRALALKDRTPAVEAQEVDPSAKRYRFGAFNVHPVGDDTIAIRPGSILYRGTVSSFLTARGVEYTSKAPGWEGPRVYFSESPNDAAGYSYIHKPDEPFDENGDPIRGEEGYKLGSGYPVLVKVRVDRELLGLLKPGFEGGGEWYIEGKFLPRRFVVGVSKLPPDQLVDDLPETIAEFAELPEYHGKAYEDIDEDKAAGYQEKREDDVSPDPVPVRIIGETLAETIDRRLRQELQGYVEKKGYTGPMSAEMRRVRLQAEYSGVDERGEATEGAASFALLQTYSHPQDRRGQGGGFLDAFSLASVGD